MGNDKYPDNWPEIAYKIKEQAGFKCERCGHEWIPNDIKIEPTVCPKCKSPYWNKPRQKKKGK